MRQGNEYAAKEVQCSTVRPRRRAARTLTLSLSLSLASSPQVVVSVLVLVVVVLFPLDGVRSICSVRGRNSSICVLCLLQLYYIIS